MQSGLPWSLSFPFRLYELDEGVDRFMYFKVVKTVFLYHDVRIADRVIPKIEICLQCS